MRTEWEYEFKEWSREYPGIEFKECIASEDRSESYEMNKASVFLLTNGKYLFAGESGCSCYGPEQADLDIHESKEKALEQFEKWKKENPVL